MGQACCCGEKEQGSTYSKDLGKEPSQKNTHHAPSIKGPMTKYLLKFSKIDEAYVLVEEKFKASKVDHTNTGSRFHNTVPSSSVSAILDDLEVPKFDDMDEVIETFFKVSERSSIDFKQFLIATATMVWQRGVKRVVCDGILSESYGLTINRLGLVNSVDPGSKAESAGILLGDKVVEINSHAVNGINYSRTLSNCIGEGAKIVFQRDMCKGLDRCDSKGWKTMTEGFSAVEAMFEDIDEDGGGSIDFEEFCSAFNMISDNSDAQVEKRLMELDINGNREIDREEFIFGISAWIGFADEEEMVDETAMS